MTLDAEDRKFITDLIQGVVRGSAIAPPPLPRLTVRQFAVAVDLHEESVRKKIRVREIPPAMVYGPPYKISPRALDLFRVTPPEALARLASRNLLPTPQPSPA